LKESHDCGIIYHGFLLMTVILQGVKGLTSAVLISARKIVDSIWFAPSISV